MEALINMLLGWAAQGQLLVGVLGIFALIALAVATLYYLAARALMGPLPVLYNAIAGDWFKMTVLTAMVCAGVFAALYLAIGAAIANKGWTVGF